MDGTDVDVTARQQRGLREHAWKPGQSGNPTGRPTGSRNRLSEIFLADLAEHWQANGVAAMDATLGKDPAAYLRVVASLMPKNVEFKDKASEVFLELLREMNKQKKPAVPGDHAKVIDHGEHGTAH